MCRYFAGLKNGSLPVRYLSLSVGDLARTGRISCGFCTDTRGKVPWLSEKIFGTVQSPVATMRNNDELDNECVSDRDFDCFTKYHQVSSVIR